MDGRSVLKVEGPDLNSRQEAWERFGPEMDGVRKTDSETGSGSHRLRLRIRLASKF